MAQLIANDEIYFGKDDRAAPKLKRFLKNVKEGTTWTTLWDFAPYNSEGSSEMAAAFGNGAIFESPKPTGLLQLILQAATDSDSLVLDFFAGASSMAAAVMRQNAADGGSRRYIMVQLDEQVSHDAVAWSEGYETISALSRERLRREGKRLSASAPNSVLDVGFRAFTIDTSNMVDVLKLPDETEQGALLDLKNSVKADRTADDLLFQVLLDWGLDLSLSVSVERVEGHQVFAVDDDGLLACFDEEVSADLVRALAKREPLRAVFRDTGFASDDARINAEQVFRELSPATDVKAI